MASTSSESLAQELLNRCLAGEEPPTALVHQLIDTGNSEALFRIVVEGLADRFEPRLCDAYSAIFSQVLERVLPGLTGLRERYERIRRPRVCLQDATKVYVLSRVTLGADIAVTSVVLDAAKQRFPHSEIYLAGGVKAAELFAGDKRIRPFAVPYPRAGSLSERLAAWPHFQDGIVIDPDSRLSQLGLLPICEEDRYFFFESRSYGCESRDNLTTLTQRWTRETFEVDAHSYMSPIPVPEQAQIAVSLGVGDNPAKRLDGASESALLKLLAAHGESVIIDRGAGGEEAERVDRTLEAAGANNLFTWNGSFAGFANIISKAKLYVGYDSAGQHAAAAAGTPQLTIFRGYVNERMLQRWSPGGRRSVILKDFDPEILLRILAEIG